MTNNNAYKIIITSRFCSSNFGEMEHVRFCSLFGEVKHVSFCSLSGETKHVRSAQFYMLPENQQQYLREFKLAAIARYEAIDPVINRLYTQYRVAKDLCISNSLIYRWLKSKNTIKA